MNSLRILFLNLLFVLLFIAKGQAVNVDHWKYCNRLKKNFKCKSKVTLGYFCLWDKATRKCNAVAEPVCNDFNKRICKHANVKKFCTFDKKAKKCVSRKEKTLSPTPMVTSAPTMKGYYEELNQGMTCKGKRVKTISMVLKSLDLCRTKCRENPDCGGFMQRVKTGTCILFQAGTCKLKQSAKVNTLMVGYRQPTLAPIPTRKPTREPTTRRPTPRPSSKPTVGPTFAPTGKPTPNPTNAAPTLEPTSVPTDAPTSSPTKLGFWDVSDAKPWSVKLEFAQTHLVKPDDSRVGPKLIAEREAEMLFTPYRGKNVPTLSPTIPPTPSTDWGSHVLGVPKVTYYSNYFTTELKDVEIIGTANKLIEAESEYYIPSEVNAVLIEAEILSNAGDLFVSATRFKTWYQTKIGSSEFGLKIKGVGWRWVNGPSASGMWNEMVEMETGVNHDEVVEAIGFKLTCSGGYWSGKWGLREINVRSGKMLQTEEDDNVEENKVENAHVPKFGADVRVAAFEGGKRLGILQVRNPNKLRPFLESSLGNFNLPALRSNAWSSTVPWEWVRNGVEIVIATIDKNTLYAKRHVFKNLKIWNRHTLTRFSLAIFGRKEGSEQFEFKNSGSKLARDMYSAMPVAELLWVDMPIVHFPYLVVPTSNGPKLVRSEAERRQAKIDAGDDPESPNLEPDYEVLKSQLGRRRDMADTGRGLLAMEAEHSLYNTGTTIVSGWSVSAEMDGGKWAWRPIGPWPNWGGAGWTGWTAIPPNSECSNLLIHELGHSMSLPHGGGECSADGPTGYDTVTRRFRTWYEVDETGPDFTNGKNDPMNGGASNNMETCFGSHYTPVHINEIQKWAETTPTILALNGKPNMYERHEDTLRPFEECTSLEITKVGVAVVTLIGTIGVENEVSQIYPEMYSSYGNVYIFPSPFELGHFEFAKSTYFLEIIYSNGAKNYAMLNLQASTLVSTDLKVFSLNLEKSKKPTKVNMYKANAAGGYPFRQEWKRSWKSKSELLFSRDISITVPSLSPPFQVGRGFLGQQKNDQLITLNEVCLSDEDVGCKKKVEWRGAWDNFDVTTSFVKDNVLSSQDTTVFALDCVRQEDNKEVKVYVNALKYQLDPSGEGKKSGLISGTFNAEADTHGLEFYLDWDLNVHLNEPGTYVSKENVKVVLDAPEFQWAGHVQVNMEVKKPTHAMTFTYKSKSLNTYYGPVVEKDDTSIYFLAKDAEVGPTSNTWWGGSETTIRVPLWVHSCPKNKKNEEGRIILNMKAQQKGCHSIWQMNAGRGADNCEHKLVLTPRGLSANPWVRNLGKGNKWAGCKVDSHSMDPLLVDAHYWHLGGGLLQEFVFHVSINH